VGDSDQRARARAGEVVQPSARLRVPHPRRRHAGHFRAHGDAAPLRLDRAAAGPVRAGALRPGTEGIDGRRGATRRRAARPRLPLTISISDGRPPRRGRVAIGCPSTRLAAMIGPLIEVRSMRHLLLLLAALSLLALPLPGSGTVAAQDLQPLEIA